MSAFNGTCCMTCVAVRFYRASNHVHQVRSLCRSTAVRAMASSQITPRSQNYRKDKPFVTPGTALCGAHSLASTSVRASVLCCAGLQQTGHWFTVPLDHASPSSQQTIEVFVREVVSLSKATHNLPLLLFLQGELCFGCACISCSAVP